MNEESYKSLFAKNCNFLAHNTTNLSKLHNLLKEGDALQAGAYPDEEIEDIISKGPPYEQNTRLYTILVKKGVEYYPQILQCLEESNNAIIVKRLKCPDSVSFSGLENLIWFDISPATKFYKGRNEEIQTIANYWQESRSSHSVIFVGITGLGGIGKSELARNYALKFYTEIKGHCIWINSETEQTFFDSFRKLAEKIKIPTVDQLEKEIPFDSIINSVLKFLSKQEYLIIFDNLDSYEEYFLNNFVNYTNSLSPTEIKPFVLMTSRNQLVHDTFGDKAKLLELQQLSKGSAISFFMDALTIRQEATRAISAAEYICERINNYPLCMQQAAAYINVKKRKSDVWTEMKEYLIALDKESKKLLNHPLPKYQNLEGVSKTTYLTWQITLDRIIRIAEVGVHAIWALNVISFFHSDNIDEIFAKTVVEKLIIEQSSSEVNKSSIEIFEILSDYSMCDRRKDGDTYKISVHRLVQEVCRIKLYEVGKLSSIINKLFKIIHDNFESIATSSSQMVHIEAVLKYVYLENDPMENKCVYYCLFIKMTEKYYQDAKYRQANELILTVIPRLESIFGLLSQHVLHMKSLNCQNLIAMGKYRQLDEILNEVYTNQQSLLREDKASLTCECGIVAFAPILTTMDNLGNLYHFQGMYNESLKMHHEVLSFGEKSFGVRQLDFETKRKIAFILDKLGRYDEALKLIDEVVEGRSKALGKNHSSTLAVLAQKGAVLHKLGKLNGALKFFQKLLKRNERMLGKEHQVTLSIKNDLASVYTSQGNYEAALKIYQELYDIFVGIFGEEHPYTLENQHRTGVMYQIQGKYSDALNVHLSVLAQRMKVLGNEHLDTLSSKFSVANVYMEKGKYELANSILQEVLDSQDRIVGKQHTDTLHRGPDWDILGHKGDIQT